MKHSIKALLLSVVLLTACDNSDFTYSSYHCNFTFDNSTHLDITLASAMNPVVKGVFCRVKYQLKSGAKYFVFENNQGAKSEKIFNAVDDRRQSEHHIGMNNGLIVGYSAYSNTFLAYDDECPDCFDYNAIPVKSYKLTLSTSGIATCNTCHRQFDLNSEGCGLTRYRASSSGEFGILSVY